VNTGQGLRTTGDNIASAAVMAAVNMTNPYSRGHPAEHCVAVDLGGRWSVVGVYGPGHDCDPQPPRGLRSHGSWSRTATLLGVPERDERSHDTAGVR
jgi:hypothetical protein